MEKRRVYMLMNVVTAVLVVGVIVYTLSVVYQQSGPSFTFKPPEGITLVEGGEIVEREVKFPNLLPLQWQATFPVTPLFKAGDVIEVDLSLLEEGRRVDEYLIRINGKPVDAKDKDVSSSYIFKLNYMNKLPDNKKIRLKIDYVVSDDTIAHRQKQKDSGDEWFWLREIYMVKLIG